jgi:hypothetical protein
MLPSLVITVLGLVSNTLSPTYAKKVPRPDSKIARNVLEGKAEGYCSVCPITYVDVAPLS